MPEQFLYERLDAASSMGFLKKDVPDSVTQNLNPKYELRPYQVEAFARFFYCYKNDFPNKAYPLHLLFNMATGSGKTLIMAGLILYLYEQGYRNFLFFVNSTNIIEKTKDNFLNPASIKYLFNQDIHIANRRVRISPVENFEAVNPGDINICFTTIQKLHSDLTSEKENALTFEDFRKHRVVLIADEAHHMNVKTKGQGELFESWENTVERIFRQNDDNLLLEFTATHDYATPAMVEKYRNKVIIRYDLLQFRNDRFSKDVVIVQSDFDQGERILQALILSQYKQEVAAKYRINLKPVILFKAQRTIAQSQENKAEFHKFIDGLTANHIASIRRSNIPLVQRAFRFFDENRISYEQLAERMKREFHPDFCLSVNDEKEKENYQILVNTLEDKTNRIRAIFAVQKLNEGWDVLNLFDIVRCYEARDTGRAKIGATTMSEAQLIGRGARYFPFVLPASPALSGAEGNDRFRRKFDGDLDHELRVLEELHYHSINDSRYIAEIRQALIEQGMMDEREVTREIKLKESFKKTQFYKYGIVWLNDRRPKDYQRVRSFADLGVKKRNYIHFIATGRGGATVALENGKKGVVVKDETSQDVKVRDIERNIVQSAIARNPFFTFATLKRYFPYLTSIRDFIASEDYLGGLEITFQGNVYGLDDNRPGKLAAMLGLMSQIESEIRANVTDYEGTRDFRRDWVREVFKDKVLKFDAQNPRVAEDAQFEYFVSAKDWFAFNTIYGTGEEKAFVRMLDRQMKKLQAQYEQIYLLRNEGHFAIYNYADGQAFQPDFVLFLREKGGRLLIYQLFIEPKGIHLKEHDRWKETFLKEITNEFGGKQLTFEDKKYRLIGVPFYNNEDENQFRASLESVLN
ncbi:MAG TPA: DEAD/DEAH box helicase family protein [Smithellaceae bacterium]|nr:DEAD/DEAH box helicase family protein [Smithellaceae bacterium]HPL50536.1 DEAD/DEAH box helicase family protein [Smithellaceae bacterium]HQG22972.1 DEAD/DEAH box helicase family protein [Smithellaceae bacterium]HRR38840.1 DEAD/DEAH box helicase family protein [Rectinema sp.]HRT36137.1 DEAD/DEAH box helicase family protein [Smithellaceae bacterium]